MPLAHARRIVSLLFQHAREAGLRNRQAQFATLLEPLGFVVAAYIPDADGAFHSADTLLIAARQQRGPRRRAFRSVGVALKKANPLPADGIDIRGADIRAAETAYIAI